MLKHVVLFTRRADSDPAALTAAMDKLAALVGPVPGFLDFAFGPNRDYEAKSPYTHGFVCTFTDRAAHLAYEAHPDHKASGAALVALTEGGYDGIFVADLEV